MSAAKDWTFTQLGPPFKTLILSGWSAPYGRQRQKPVVEDGIKIREATTYYPGFDGPPTRHVFGAQYTPWDLTGRFQDPVGGAGYAKSQTEYIKQFVLDQQPVRISWGDIASVNGFIDEFTPSREAEAQVAWKMHILVDEDLRADKGATANYVRTPKSYLPLPADIASIAPPPPRPDAVYKPSILEGLDNAVSSFNSAIANVVQITNAIDSFEKALAGDIKRLRAGIGQVRTAALNLGTTMQSIQTDAFLVRRLATSDIEGLGYLAKSTVSLTALLGKLAELDRQAEIAERGKASTSYVAQLGDTWESLSTKFYNAPDKAQKIRDANAIRGGGQPEAGRSYKIPFQ